jgi:hypothetical protein
MLMSINGLASIKAKLAFKYPDNGKYETDIAMRVILPPR